jgi:hypothetical protein
MHADLKIGAIGKEPKSSVETNFIDGDGSASAWLGACTAMSLAQADGQTEQCVEVRIHDFTFIASLAGLQHC